MILNLFRRIQLSLNQPKNGDSFFADPLDFMCDSLSERIFFEMTDRHGHTLWNFIHGNNTYRFTILSTAMPYYICDVEIMVSSRENPNKRVWLKRTRQRRIWKKDFHRLILENRMVKTKAQSLFHGRD